MTNIAPLMPVYDRADIHFEQGKGSFLFTTTGERYLDFVAGMAVVGLGHCHPYVTGKLHAQAAKLWTCSNLFHSDESETLAKRLVDACFADTVFFQNSGVEAWECGVKTIRKYQSTIGKPERFRLLSFEGCFHGRTLGAIAASKSSKMINGFGPPMDGFDVVPWDDIGAVHAAIGPETAGIVIEPIAGEGGVKQASAAFLQALRDLCDANGLLLYFDEIQCGMGRTGRLFCHEWSGVPPDVMCIAKALGNGFPIGACLASEKAAQGMTLGTHGSTFGGNPLAMAVANAVLDVMTDKDFLPTVLSRGQELTIGLDQIVSDHPKVFVERRGLGLLQGLRCASSNKIVIEVLRQRRFLAAAANENVVRLLPPLTISQDELAQALTIIRSTAQNLEAAL